MLVCCIFGHPKSDPINLRSSLSHHPINNQPPTDNQLDDLDGVKLLKDSVDLDSSTDYDYCFNEYKLSESINE